jgi:subtilisin family serine protease
VVKIEGTRRLRPDLNESVPEIQAGPDNFPASEFTGADVIVGVIDSGFDFLHPVFRRAEGGVRILAIWDQTLDPDEVGIESPAGFDIGVEFNSEAIEEAIEAADEFGNDVARSMVPTTDKNGHGTAVAGIAAGNGSIAGNCRGANTFVGVAPEAELIFVKREAEDDIPAIGESQNLIDALDYIFNHPERNGRPVVINISLGDNLGPHDGTSLVEQAIDAFLLLPGRAVVKSAGNEASERRHARATVDAGDTLELGFEVMPDDKEDRHLELWYRGSGTLTARVTAPVNPVVQSAELSPGDPEDDFEVGAADDPTVVTLEVLDTDADNGDRSIGLELEAPEDGNSLPSGEWILELRNPTGQDIEIDAWIDRGDNAPKFTDFFTRETTVGIPGTSELVITVAAYSQETSARGEVDRDSGEGPTRRRSTAPQDPRQKPDIAAPGVATSARANKEESGCSDCCLSFYIAKGGKTGSTSFAAPHVTGAIALMFEKKKDLTARDIKRILEESATEPEGEPDEPLPNFEWGAGRLDVSLALEEIEGDDGGGGGGEEDDGGPVPFAVGRVPAGPAFARPHPRRGTLVPLSRTAAFSLLRERTLATPAGQLYAAIVSRHFSGVRALIRTNRRVAAVWHRIGGPQLIGALAQRVFAPDAPLPSMLNGVPLADGVARFLRTLERYGAPDLQRAVAGYGPLILAIAGQSLNQILHADVAALPSALSAA